MTLNTETVDDQQRREDKERRDVPRNSPEDRTISRDQLSAWNEFKLNIEAQFQRLSTEIGRLGQEGGATRTHFNSLQDGLTGIRNQIRAFNLGNEPVPEFDPNEPNFRRPENTNTLEKPVSNRR